MKHLSITLGGLLCYFCFTEMALNPVEAYIFEDNLLVLLIGVF